MPRDREIVVTVRTRPFLEPAVVKAGKYTNAGLEREMDRLLGHVSQSGVKADLVGCMGGETAFTKAGTIHTKPLRIKPGSRVPKQMVDTVRALFGGSLTAALLAQGLSKVAWEKGGSAWAGTKCSAWAGTKSIALVRLKAAARAGFAHVSFEGRIGRGASPVFVISKRGRDLLEGTGATMPIKTRRVGRTEFVRISAQPAA